MAQAQGRKALVIGGSLSGLLVGLLLRRQGWQVEIYERVGVELAGRGAGIVTHKPLWDALDQIGIAWRNNLGVEIETRRLFGLDGAQQLEIACPQTMTAWDRMYDLLRSAVPNEHYHRAKELIGIEEDGKGIRARFADGSVASGDVLIGSDGLRSTVRGLLAPEVRPIYAGYVAWRGLVAESALPPDLHAQAFMHMAFCLPNNEQMLGYPVAGAGNDLRQGHRRYNLVWYRPAPEGAALKRLLTDGNGVTHELTIPPPLVLQACVDEMMAAADRLLSPQFRTLWHLSERPFLQPIYDVQSSRLAFGRATIIGDASFVARPHCGAGVTKAADDAMTLAAALAAETDVPAALKRYEAVRVPIGSRVVAHARRLGTDLQSGSTADGQARRAVATFSPEQVLRETATLDFLV